MKRILMTLAALAAACGWAPAQPAADAAADDPSRITTFTVVNAISEREIVICERPQPFSLRKVKIYDVDGIPVTDLAAIEGPFKANAVYRIDADDDEPRLTELWIVVRYRVNGEGRLEAVRWTPGMEAYVRSENR
ncbi:MAG: hypothetical protein MUF78_07105 [Candidatus Edwardsbacteria bacterium]|jgi:hypothetical protein|nr:hypothetical protein [Candidatus Edwardsbacteria bacterium]